MRIREILCSSEEFSDTCEEFSGTCEEFSGTCEEFSGTCEEFSGTCEEFSGTCGGIFWYLRRVFWYLRRVFWYLRGVPRYQNRVARTQKTSHFIDFQTHFPFRHQKCYKNTFFILFFLPTILFAQQNLPLNREWGLGYEKEVNKIHPKMPKSLEDKITKSKDSTFVVDGKTYKVGFPRQKDTIEDLSNFKPYIVTPTFSKKDKSKGNYLYRKIKKESFMIVNDTADKFQLNVDPLLNVQLGKDFASKTGGKLYTNTRGFVVKGAIGKKVAFESSFYENQSTFPNYVDTAIAQSNKLFPQTANYNYAVVPGQGRSKPFRTKGYDYAMSSGYVSYTPFKMLNVQVGNGKHFVGDGYRSLLLSDNAFNYPFARITTTYKHIQYTNLYTSFMNLTDGGVKTPPHSERLFQKKVGSFQMLNFHLFDIVHIGLFQGMIWEAADSNNRQHVNFNTFDPIIGVNAANYGLHGTNNILYGATLKVKFTKSISVYGQYMLDDVASASNTDKRNNKTGYQIGIKYFDLFTIKNLHAQFEYNTVRPYAYAATNTEQSYTHYNQPLAHPLGANFYEMVGFINYKIKDFFIEYKAIYAVKGADSSGFNYGGNIFKADNVFASTQNPDNIYALQGVKTTLIIEDIHIGYLVNPNTNFNIVLGLTNRTQQTNNKTYNTQFIYVGIRTSLTNLYYDF